MADSGAISKKRLRRIVYELVEPEARGKQGLSWVNKVLVVGVLIGTCVAVLATEASIAVRFKDVIVGLELAIGCLFLIEYCLRIWVAPEGHPTEKPFRARLRFMCSVSALVDLIVLVATFSPFFLANLAILRLVRLVLIFRLAKLGRMSRAMKNLSVAVHSRRYELGLTLGLALGLLLAGATALYMIEGESQPEKFGSIPRALWWAVITMTTIGYGDVYPETPLGKLVASLVAIVGIGFIAMPTGILAAAFSDAMQKQNNDD